MAEVPEKNEKQNEQARRRTSEGTFKELKGVRRYRKGRTICDTLFGRCRYGKDIVTNNWVIIKESKRWHVENRISIRGLHVAEDLGQEIAMHQKIMKEPGLPLNIVRLIDVCEDPNYIYVITEFCQGGDLFSFVHNSHPVYKKKTISSPPVQTDNNKMDVEPEVNSDAMDVERFPEENQRWFDIIRGLYRQLAQCIAWMHSKRYCHRDLSLENVLLTKDGTVKVIDFGVCKFYPESNESFTTRAGFVGKQGYCSPEVYALKGYDGRKADSWSLGVILFLLLTGAPPYRVPVNSDAGFRLIMKGDMKKMLEAWQRPIEAEAYDLLAKIFQFEPERATPADMVSHSYCTAAPEDSAPVILADEKSLDHTS